MQKHEDSKAPKFFPCTWPECGLVCHDAGKLRRHYIIHTGEKPYKCDICEKGFGLEYNMKIHRRIHSGDRPYKCEVCNKSFAQKSNLNLHMNTHLVQGRKSGNVCTTMEQQGIVPQGLNAYYRKKLQKYYEERKAMRPIFNIQRGRIRFTTAKLGLEDAVGDMVNVPGARNTKDLYQLSSQTYLVELL